VLIIPSSWGSQLDGDLHQHTVLHHFSMQQRAGSLDLNDLPFDLNEDAGVIPPNYFTQLMDEAIDESPHQPMDTEAPNVNVNLGQGDTDTGPFIAPTNTTTVAEEADDEEASSQPTEP
jgi:hypothetical protein